MNIDFISASSVATSAYDCYRKECTWNNSVENEDFGYYPSTNLSCSRCMDECDDDPKCKGVECGLKLCRWWKNQTCNKTQLLFTPKKDIETCFKMIPFQCKDLLRVIVF